MDSVGALKSIYGIDWASVEERDAGIARTREVTGGLMDARMSPEVGGRDVDLEGLRVFATALEQDFSEFRYLAEEVEPAGDQTAVVTGTISCRGRASKMPLSAEFGHVWELQDGRPVRVQAYLSRADARRAAGLDP